METSDLTVPIARRSSIPDLRRKPGPLRRAAKRVLSKALFSMGYRLESVSPADSTTVSAEDLPSDSTSLLVTDELYGPVIRAVKPFTMTTYGRIAALSDAAR